jgi:hypothetical protein
MTKLNPEPSSRLRCEQCGRVGTRGFKVLGDFTDERGHIPRIVVCAAVTACRKRWPT